MHELSLCHSIYTIADRAREGQRVEVIHLRIGLLRQVVPETLLYCWGLLSESTDLAGSELDIERVAIELRCELCASRTVVSQNLVLTCAACDSGQVEVVMGEEFLITSMDLAESPH